MCLPHSLRSRFILVVVFAAIAPLALLGAWLTGSASRSGEDAARDRLDALLQTTAAAVGTEWLKVRSRLLDLAGSPDVLARLSGDRQAEGAIDGLPALPVVRVSILDLSDVPVWRSQPPGSAGPATEGPTLRVRLPILAAQAGDKVGTLEAEVDVGDLVETPQLGGLPVGTVLAASDPTTGSSLLPIPFDRDMLTLERFGWGGDDWITRRRTLREPRVEFVAAAPISLITEPFARVAKQGLVLLTIVAALSLLITAALTGVMTRSLARLTAAADAVSAGDLEHQVPSPGHDEVGRVAKAFNTMTGSLRRTLREAADRQSLVAVGEFAASLSHEVRNALSSIRLDLQVGAELLPDDPRLREPQERALREIGRLEGTVSGALELARSGKLELGVLDLRDPLGNAVTAARSEFADRRAHLEGSPSGPPVEVLGDGPGLEQLFLNLLLNAAQAAGVDGTAAVRVAVDADTVRVTVEDDGPGMEPEVLERAFEAFYSTRPDGSGLGLAVARRIARLHGGRLKIDTQLGRGTRVEVSLPLWGERAGHPTKVEEGVTIPGTRV